MNLKSELQTLNNALDKQKRQLEAAKNRNDQSMINHFTERTAATLRKIDAIKGQISRKLGSKADSIKQLAFNRVLTKAEQADMGKLKKSVKGLVVVHPMTALGRDIGVKEVTGYAPKAF